MNREHVCYIEGGSIMNTATGCFIENPAILVSKTEDIIHAWGNFDTVEAKFNKYTSAYNQAGLTDMANDLLLIELSQYHNVTREMACYIMRRAAEFTATGFVKNLCEQLTSGSDPVAWLTAEMERIPLDLEKREWR